MTKIFKIFSLLFFSMLLTHCKNNEENKKESVVSEEKNSAENKCMDAYIESNKTLAAQRDNNSKIISLSESIDLYVKSMKGIDYKQCPGAFAAAFDDYLDTWSDLKEVTNNYPNLRGEMQVLFNQLKNEKEGVHFKELLANIWSSWEKVERAMSQF